MKRFATLMGAAALLAALVQPAGAETKLRISLQLPLKSHLGQNLLVFKEEVERESKGDLVVEIYDSAQLYKDKEVPQAVGTGQIEMGVASLTRYVGDIPAVDVFYMPFLFNTPELIRKATAPGSPVRQPLDDAILGTGGRVLWWQAYGSNILLSKGSPIKTLRGRARAPCPPAYTSPSFRSANELRCGSSFPTLRGRTTRWRATEKDTRRPHSSPPSDFGRCPGESSPGHRSRWGFLSGPSIES